MNGDFKAANKAFRQALSVDPEITLQIMQGSKVYQQIFSNREFSSVQMDANIKEAQKEAYHLLRAKDNSRNSLKNLDLKFF